MVKCEKTLLALLVFANDTALLVTTEQDLQIMLNSPYSWCELWLLNTNTSKVHLEQVETSLQP